MESLHEAKHSTLPGATNTELVLQNRDPHATSATDLQLPEEAGIGEASEAPPTHFPTSDPHNNESPHAQKPDLPGETEETRMCSKTTCCILNAGVANDETPERDGFVNTVDSSGRESGNEADDGCEEEQISHPATSDQTMTHEDGDHSTGLTEGTLGPQHETFEVGEEPPGLDVSVQSERAAVHPTDHRPADLADEEGNPILAPSSLYTRRAQRRRQRGREAAPAEGETASDTVDSNFYPPVPPGSPPFSESPYAARLRRKQMEIPSLIVSSKRSEPRRVPSEPHRSASLQPPPPIGESPNSARSLRRASVQPIHTSPPAESLTPWTENQVRHAMQSVQPQSSSFQSPPGIVGGSPCAARLRRKNSQDARSTCSSETSLSSVQSPSTPDTYPGTPDSDPRLGNGPDFETPADLLQANDPSPDVHVNLDATAPTVEIESHDIQGPALRDIIAPEGSEILLPDLLGRVSERSLPCSGMDEGDRLVAELENGERPQTAPRYGDLAMEDPNDDQSFIHIPMVSRGSFINGGAGPLLSDDTPGAFSAQGRAFGDMPDWFRNQQGGRATRPHSLPPSTSARSIRSYLSSSSGDQSPPINDGSTRQLRLSTPHGSFTVRAQYNRTHSQSIPEAREPDGLVTARATLIRGASSVNGCQSPSFRQTVEDSEVLTIQAGEAISIISAGDVVDEGVIQACKMKLVIKFIVCCMIGLLTIVLPVILLVSEPDPTTHLPLFPFNNTLPNREEICHGVIYHPFFPMSPLVECYCHGEVPGIPAGIIDTYRPLVDMLVTHKAISKAPLLTNCSDPRNLALLWLAEAEPEMVSNKTRTIVRFRLAVLFHSLGGMDWIDRTMWLSSNPECDWYGVTCYDDSREVKIELPDNGLVAGTIPAELSELKDLQMQNLSGKRYVMGNITW
jgi:hypothetical protein